MSLSRKATSYWGKDYRKSAVMCSNCNGHHRFWTYQRVGEFFQGLILGGMFLGWIGGAMFMGLKDQYGLPLRHLYYLITGWIGTGCIIGFFCGIFTDCGYFKHTYSPADFLAASDYYQSDPDRQGAY